MWLLENSGGAFQGRRLWLRPGKRYLFGRTRAEAGQLVISDKTISRKHLTIEVGRVTDGDGQNRSSRSVVTIEDLNTKIGTVVNGTQIRGQKFVLVQDANEIKMGHMADLFRITWHPVVLTFSFTSKELRADPWTRLRADLEQLDIKYIPEYDIALTTHVVAKKRNTSKGLQALINGKHIVMDSFIAAVVQATAVPTEADSGGNAAGAASPLEQDFDGSWPDALAYLPPRGDEPSDRAVSTYGPDARRRDIFDGYTFIFCDQKQYENLLPPITNGKGKALCGEVVPGHTEVDDFVRYVKGIAGEKSLGEFEDGSEGKGVVVVRYLPAKGDHVEWFARFTTAVALRLDHRLIDQREFLDAILAAEPGMLRRPLEEETEAPPSATQSGPPQQAATSFASTRKGRSRRGLTSRFKGFDVDLDLNPDQDSLSTSVEQTQAPQTQAQANVGAHDDGMFVSQNQTPAEPESGLARNSRKRPAAAVEKDVMEDIAPTAAAVKRRRIEAGVDPIPARESPEAEEEEEDVDMADVALKGKPAKGKGKVKEENGILDQARRNREAAEKRAAEEQERLTSIPDDGLDAEAIRKLTLVEEIAVRAPTVPRSREQEIADGRWDPRWNGRRNFKKFRKQGDVTGRPVPRVIVALEPAKTKEYGIGDDYWLEAEESSSWKQQQRRKESRPQSTADSNANMLTGTTSSSRPKDKGKGVTALPGSIGLAESGDSGLFSRRTGDTNGTASRPLERDGDNSELVSLDIVPDTEPEDGSDAISIARPDPEADLPRTRAGKVAQRDALRQSQASQARVQLRTTRPREPTPSLELETTQGTDGRGKRPAGGRAAARASPVKRPRRGGTAPIAIHDSDSDDDDDELRFKFRSRRGK